MGITVKFQTYCNLIAIALVVSIIVIYVQPVNHLSTEVVNWTANLKPNTQHQVTISDLPKGQVFEWGRAERPFSSLPIGGEGFVHWVHSCHGRLSLTNEQDIYKDEGESPSGHVKKVGPTKAWLDLSYKVPEFNWDADPGVCELEEIKIVGTYKSKP